MAEPSVLLILPPFSQLNTPYPATSYLCGFLRGRGVACHQVDLSIETLLALLRREGLRRVFDQVASLEDLPGPALAMLEQRRRYESTVDGVVAFLQGRDPTLAHRIVRGDWLPEGPRLAARGEHLVQAFGEMGLADHARHLCTLYLNDVTDLVRATVDPHFGLTRYATHIATAAHSYDPLAEALAAPPSLVEAWMLERLEQHLQRVRPSLVGLSVPFPGNLLAALRCGQWIKAHHPGVKVALGGGYANTELRSLREPRLFDVLDYVILDDGEGPLLALLDHLAGGRPQEGLKRTFVREGGQVVYHRGPKEAEIPFSQAGTPTYDGLPLDRYLSVLDVLNPMHRLWSDGRWNKLTVAHGCYWKKCSFCDVHLDYIGRYDPAPARLLVGRMEALVRETGQSGFHFVDEAAPPHVLKELALEILARGLTVTWWGNVRFERRFDEDLCRLLAASGGIAVSGGLEVASDRLLGLMNKGVTVEQVARVAGAFTAAGIRVHAYLMYGFPTQTDAETIGSLERVRQLFEGGVIQSGFWHRFTATRHSPIGAAPEAWGIEVLPPPPGAFADNDLEYVDPVAADHDRLGRGLDLALMNYMSGLGLEEPLERFFEGPIPPHDVPPDLVQRALQAPGPSDQERQGQRLCWLGEAPTLGEPREKRARLRRGGAGGVVRDLGLRGPGGEESLAASPEVAELLAEWLQRAAPHLRGETDLPRLGDLLAAYAARTGRPAESLLEGRVWEGLRRVGLVLV